MTASAYSVVRLRREQRYMRLRAQGYRSYPDYLKSPCWRALKARYRASDQPQDCICGEVNRVQLHHMTYERVGREELTDLTPLCPPCHAMIHKLEAAGEIGLDFSGFVSEKRARRYDDERAGLRDRVDKDKARRMAQDQRLAIRSSLGALRQALIAAEKRGEDVSGCLKQVKQMVEALNANS